MTEQCCHRRNENRAQRLDGEPQATQLVSGRDGTQTVACVSTLLHPALPQQSTGRALSRWGQTLGLRSSWLLHPGPRALTEGRSPSALFSSALSRKETPRRAPAEEGLDQRWLLARPAARSEGVQARLHPLAAKKQRAITQPPKSPLPSLSHEDNHDSAALGLLWALIGIITQSAEPIIFGITSVLITQAHRKRNKIH